MGTGVLIGIGVAGFVDEVVFHQLLHWHHFYDRGTSTAGLVSDGFFHAFSWTAVVVGLFLLADLHRRHDVDLRLSTGVSSVESRPEGAVVRLDDGTAVGADLIVVGIGAVPSTELAEAAGLKVENGVLADEHLVTSRVAVGGASARSISLRKCFVTPL